MYEVDDEMEWIQFMKWSGRIEEMACNPWHVLFICRKTLNFKFWYGNEVDEVWNEMNNIWNEVKYEWMDEMEYGWISEWNEMKWDGS